jgi:hypothetical protein
MRPIFKNKEIYTIYCDINQDSFGNLSVYLYIQIDKREIKLFESMSRDRCGVRASGTQDEARTHVSMLLLSLTRLNRVRVCAKCEILDNTREKTHLNIRTFATDSARGKNTITSAIVLRDSRRIYK